MLRVTLLNKLNKKKVEKRKPIKELEREVKREIDEKDTKEPYGFTKQDILAMIIAGYQVIMPIVLIGVLALIAFVLIFLKIYS
ncbi:hypothetical protein K8M07_11415 [Schnuerera sp. xch1]|uniref:hypothetical protein n=1 Tax=Schnuerera sp. xch1 TaxID=2874283 RepID=UPI001CC0648A|nr:hypothetical protein [Schnuerera sp. xch1]MBZ2175845.1 hypothetical protein [Schnuerera sp. xch1]